MSALREIIAYFGIEVDSSQLDKGKDKLENFIDTAKGIGEKFAVAFAVEKVKEFVMHIADAAEALEMQAQTIGMSTDALQQWHLAAELSGLTAGQLDAAMMRLSRTAGGKGGQALAALGVQATDAHGKVKPMEELMESVADKISKIDDPTKRAEAATKLFGKTGAKLIPFLSEGKEGIKKMREEMKLLGGGMSEDFIKRAKEMGDNAKRLSFAWDSLKYRVVDLLIPAFEKIIHWLTEGVKWILKLVDTSSTFETILGVLAVAATVAFSAMLGPLGEILLAMAPVIAAFLILEDLVTFFRGGDSEFGALLDTLFGDGTAAKVQKWINDAIEDFKNFIDFLMGGSSDAANKWREDWQVFKDKFVKDTGDLGRVVLWFLGLFTGGWKNATDQIEAVWNVAVTMLKIGWNGFVRLAMSGIWGIQDAFGTFVNGLLEGAKLILQGMKAIAVATGRTGLANTIDQGLSKIQGSVMATDHGALGNAAIDAEQATLTEKLLRNTDLIGGVKTVSTESLEDDRLRKWTQDAVNRSNHQTNNININVPHGTPHGVAQAAGEAAREGVNRANAAALIPGDG